MTARLEAARIVLTRPAAPDDELGGRLATEGAQVLRFPALLVEPLAAPLPPGEFDAAVFTSPASVRHGLARIASALPPLLAATGEGTARRLAAAGVRRVLVPESGAGLAALVGSGAAAQFAGRRVLLVCGRPVNRRSLDLLASHAAEAAAFPVYRRRPNREPEPLAGWLRSGGADAIMASSAAAVAALTDLPGIAWREVSWIVSSRRVAQAVERSGGRTAAVAASADDDDLVAAAIRWWQSARQGGSE